jgi:hypothetical protein
LLVWACWPIKAAVKSFVLHVFVVALAVIVFERLQIMFVLAFIFIEVTFLRTLLQTLKLTRTGFAGLYIILSALAYYTAYGNLSISSFFEEGRATILGAQITDYSYWNLTLITMFLIAKLVLVEVIMLLPLIQAEDDAAVLDQFANNLSAAFSLSIIALLAVIWWRYSPGQQSLLSNLSTDLLFIGIKVIVVTLGLLLINQVFARAKSLAAKSA